MSQQMPPVSRPPSGAPNGGQITGQDRTVELGPNNQAVSGVRVTFRTGKGVTGSVFVPDAQYSGAAAIAAARAAANEIDQAHGATI